MPEPMNIVVTGGLGFLGINLVNHLLDQGHRIAIIDPAAAPATEDVGFTARPGGRIAFTEAEPYRRTVEHWQGVTRVALGDLRAHLWGWVDRVYHLGANASPPIYKADPIGSLLAGSEDTHAICRFVNSFSPALNPVEHKRRGSCRLLLASTSEVYGDPEVHPQVETYRGNVDPRGPRSMYDEAKRYAEAYVTAFAATQPVDARIARIFNTYGPHMRLTDGRMIPEFIRACLEGRPLEVHEPGTQTRTLCYVQDLVAGLVALMEAPQKALAPATDGTRVPCLNLGGTSEELTVRQVAGLVQVAYGPDAPPIRLVPQPCAQDPKIRRPDVTRARSLLGWEPKFSPELGIKLTIRWAQHAI